MSENRKLKTENRVLPYFQLLRLPNVFTAVADVLMGFLFTHESFDDWGIFSLLSAASASLYSAGMALNDYYDRDIDAQERPSRPIPSGRVSETTARNLGFGLLVTGVVLGVAAAVVVQDARPAVVAVLLAMAIVAYNRLLKHTPVGPLAMGTCRFLNVLLGMSAAGEAWARTDWLAALAVGGYIMGVTIMSRGEAGRSHRAFLITGIFAIAAALFLAYSLGEFAEAGHRPPLVPPNRWYLFWIVAGTILLWRCIVAVADPSSEKVQAAVKHCLLGLIVLDAGLVLLVQPASYAIAVLLLLAPAIVLGKWVYST